MNILTKVILMAAAAPSLLQAQAPTEVKLRTLGFDEWSGQYQTLDDKGNLLHAIHISRLDVNSRFCLDAPVRITFDSKEGRVLKNAGWYEWNPVRKRWFKIALPKYIAHKDKAAGGLYCIEVRCPGIYGIFFRPVAQQQGIVFKAPLFHRITRLEVMQESPGISLVLTPERPERAIHLPTNDVSYSTKIVAVLVNPDGDTCQLSGLMLGGLCATEKIRDGSKKHRVNLTRSMVTGLRTEANDLSTEQVTYKPR